MVDIPSDCHFQGPCQCLEDAFYFMVLVIAFGTDMEIHLGSIAEALEEMQEHLSRHLPDFFPMELRVPNEPRSSPEVQGYLTEAIIHGKAIAIPLDSPLVT